MWTRISDIDNIILNELGILDNYSLPFYNVPHTQDRPHLVEDITDFVKEKGIHEGSGCVLNAENHRRCGEIQGIA